jgi:metallopeptidase family M12-like protein
MRCADLIGRFAWFAVLFAAVAFGTQAALGKATTREARVELILSDLPARTSKDYTDLLRIAGRDVRVHVLGISSSETWSLPRSRLKDVTHRLERLGIKATVVDIDWNRLLKPPGAGLKMTSGQELVLEALKASNEAMVVGVMASLNDAPAEYALTRDAQGRVTTTRPGARVIIPFSDKEQVTAVRKSIEKKTQGWTWRGEIEGTGEPVMLMWWKGGKFTGVFTYRGHIYTLRNIGGDVLAILETEPSKLPPDHGPMPGADQKIALKDDPLFSRGEGAAARSLQAQKDGATESKGLLRTAGTWLAPVVDLAIGQRPTTIVPLPAAKRRQLAARKVTIDVMILYTPKVAKRYLDIDTDLIALSIEQANQSFANSGMGNIELRLAHQQQINYDEAKGEHFEHLYRMVDGKAPFENVHALRDEKRADVVVLIVDDASGCGLSTRVAAGADEAFSVVHHTCAALTYSIAHEIGHIIGARHEKALDSSTMPFPYGHGYVNGTKWRDIMSYRQSCNGCPRVPYWSNPTIKIRGEPGGSVDADNARVILEQAERVSNFR